MANLKKTEELWAEVEEQWKVTKIVNMVKGGLDLKEVQERLLYEIEDSADVADFVDDFVREILKVLYK